MSLVKTAGLTGAKLDWAVAYINSLELQHDLPTIECDKHNAVWLFLPPNPFNDYRELWQPTNDWSQAGPIIDREKIGVMWLDYSNKRNPQEQWSAGYEGEFLHSGKTPLEAALRCYVASKMGDEVEIPDELLGDTNGLN